MLARAAPRSQRCHWYVKAIGCVPVQCPARRSRAWSTCGVPVIVGATVFVGAVRALTTMAVGREVAASAEPTVFAPVTITRSVAPDVIGDDGVGLRRADVGAVRARRGEQRCQR